MNRKINDTVAQVHPWPGAARVQLIVALFDDLDDSPYHQKKAGKRIVNSAPAKGYTRGFRPQPTQDVLNRRKNQYILQRQEFERLKQVIYPLLFIALAFTDT